MSSTHNSWRSLEELYQAALDRPPGEREAFLKESCADPDLRLEVQSLLGFAMEDDRLLEHSPWTQAGGLEPGASFRPYRIEEKIGEGGMGEVYRARDSRLGRDVALKILPADMTADPDRRARFVREAQSAARLNHPGIVTIYDIGERDGRIYIAMEYVKGKALADVIPSSGLPAADVLRHAISIASALAKAHAAGVIHRDIKPGNIMVTSDGLVKVLDFGLAKLLEETGPAEETALLALSQPGIVMGTPAFMSPEQAEGKVVDARSDIFSFGSVLYEAATGKRAFAGSSIAATLAAVLYKDPEPIHANFPPELAEVIMRCLRKGPEQRFQTMGDVKVALERGCSSELDNKTGTSSKPSVAVLPFVNMSGDKENEYFSDGLAEEIINLLAQIPGLKVIARTSAFAFRGKEQDLASIAQALRVATILQGSVRRAGQRIRVAAQLINAADGCHLWSQRYDREMADVFELQDEIAAAIAAALEVKLAPGGGRERYKPNLPAYEAYLKAHYHSIRLSPKSWARAKEYFEQAIALDPKFALAYSEFGMHFSSLAVYGLKAPDEVLLPARALAQKALDLDPSLPDARALLAIVAALFDHDWKDAERQFGLAMAREPVSALAGLFQALYRIALGQPLQAVAQLRRAVEEDPLYLFHRYILAMALWAAGQNEDALHEVRHLLALDENYAQAHWRLATYYAWRGEIGEALRCAEKAYALAPHLPDVTGTVAGLLARTGEADRARALLATLGAPETYGVPRGYAYFHLFNGQSDEAAEWWEKMVDQRDSAALIMARLPYGKPLRDSARWAACARRMNLPEAI